MFKRSSQPSLNEAKIFGTPFGGSQFGDLTPSPLGGLRLDADEAKREKIREAFEWSWSAYESHAFGDDEVSLDLVSW